MPTPKNAWMRSFPIPRAKPRASPQTAPRVFVRLLKSPSRKTAAIGGETVVAFVVTRPGHAFDEASLERTALAYVSRYATTRGRLVGDTVELEEPQPRVAPGQVVALYERDLVVGAGYAV
mgnify:CR=1 FL=1